MLLALGIGNTCVQLGLFRGEELLRSWRIAEPTARTPDLGLTPEEEGAVEAVIACSVAPSALAGVRAALEGSRLPGVRLVERAAQSRIATRYCDPETVGMDRLVACRAARDLHGAPCLVVDLGTAITFDAVSAQGEHLGGAIAPGVGVSARALAAEAELLTTFELACPTGAIATSTRACLDSGFVLGFAGMIDEMVRRTRDEMQARVRAIATGGDAGLIVPHCREIEIVDEGLVLQGLRLIHEDEARA